MRNLKMLIFIAVLFLAVGCVKSSALEVGEKAPDFTLPDMDGKQVSLSEFSGKVVILDFFASWCPPCRQEVPDFIELEKEYSGKGFAMVGISLVNAGEARDFAEKTGINYTVLIDDNKVSDLYGPIRSIPTTFILDRSGKIARLYIGFRPKNVFEADIKELLK